ncbi:MAG: hypothetical protein DWI28_02215 [Planctomycetota bacterium]|nr:MAG: hypothetical protein DWI28_02215 [Planctomycetota bacterium]
MVPWRAYPLQPRQRPFTTEAEALYNRGRGPWPGGEVGKLLASGSKIFLIFRRAFGYQLFSLNRIFS